MLSIAFYFLDLGGLLLLPPPPTKFTLNSPTLYESAENTFIYYSPLDEQSIKKCRQTRWLSIEIKEYQPCLRQNVFGPVLLLQTKCVLQ